MKPNKAASTLSGANDPKMPGTMSVPTGRPRPIRDGMYRDRVREAARQVREDNREILNRLAKK